MTSLSVDPLMVSLIQVASSLPMFLLALSAGALADIVDKRRLLILSEISITIVSTTLAALVWLDRRLVVVALAQASERSVAD